MSCVMQLLGLLMGLEKLDMEEHGSVGMKMNICVHVIIMISSSIQGQNEHMIYILI